MSHCPICHAIYAKEDVRLVEEKSQARLYHSACAACGHGLLAYVLEISGGVSSLGLVTDASGMDCVRMAGQLPIGSEECMAFHRVIADQSRDLCRRLLDPSISSGSTQPFSPGGFPSIDSGPELVEGRPKGSENLGVDMSGKPA